MAEQSLLYGIIQDILGRPKKTNQNKQQYSFDCPTCYKLPLLMSLLILLHNGLKLV
jgi:hypothetical protein